MRGILFDLKEFALNDGGGIRTTAFFKGCPLRCAWCHNPEGQSLEREIYLKHNGCLHCGLCMRPCTHPECQGLGRCLHICPNNLVGVKGQEWESEALAERLRKNADLYRSTGGGVTFSGGEPLMQADFACEVYDLLPGIHKAIETCGFAKEETFRKTVSRCDLVMMDLKIIDPEAHKAWTGADNSLILKNAAWLKQSGLNHIFRVPLIPGVTDSHENQAAIAEIAGDSRVELLSYNKLAPAKYKAVGKTYTDKIDGNRPVNAELSLFQNAILRK